VKKVLKLVAGGVFGIIVSFYLTFVVQTLWNWFGQPAFHVDLSYWNMYGLLLIVNLLKMRNTDPEDAHMLFKTMTMVQACVPEEKRAAITKEFGEDEFEKWFRPAMLQGMKAVGATVWLVLGFGIHILAV
jgi:hypothetical protein